MAPLADIRIDEHVEGNRHVVRLGLPAGTTAAEVSASYEDGVLTVTFPVVPGAGAAQRVRISHGKLPVE